MFYTVSVNASNNIFFTAENGTTLQLDATTQRAVNERFDFYSRHPSIHQNSLLNAIRYVKLGFFFHLFLSDSYVSHSKRGVSFWPSSIEEDATLESVITQLNEQGPVDDTADSVFEFLLNHYFHEGLNFGALPDGGVFVVPPVGNAFIIEFPKKIGGLIDFVIREGVGEFGPRGEFMWGMMEKNKFGEYSEIETSKLREMLGITKEIPELWKLREMANAAYFEKKRKEEEALEAKLAETKSAE